MVKIALIGKMCSGKTTFLRNILKQYPGIQTFSFGDAVKHYIHELFGVDTLRTKPRTFIQDFAETMKTFDKNVWVNILKTHIIQSNHSHIVVGDVRFENEYQMLKEQGFLFIKLDIDDTLQLMRLRQTYPENYQEHIDRRTHQSETQIDTFDADYYVYSNGNDPMDLFNTLMRQMINECDQELQSLATCLESH